MEANVSSSLQLANLVNPERTARKPARYLHFFWKCGGQRSYHMQVPCCVRAKERIRGFVTLKASCSAENRQGMMGSGKTTVAGVLSEALGYSFVDCDVLIEEAVSGSTVAEIFKLHGESFFRDNETEVLKKLSSMHQLVVSTGGGAVIQPVNWRHMRKGISIWLDVPLEALARRIVTVGTGSRPLLHHGDGDPYVKTMKRLSKLFKEKGEAYANADVRVSLENMAEKLGYEDVSDLSPTAIAIEALIRIEHFLTK